MPKRQKYATIILISLIFSLLTCNIVAEADNGGPSITKNPTSEAIAMGGRTWFIAHADNASSMSWELVDPNGYVHTLTEAMTMNPGLNLQALEGDTIAVSNVPPSVNGWGVQATFYGPGGSASTSPAYIYVGDFLNAYNSVIEYYRIAKQAEPYNYQDGYAVSEFIRSYEHVGYALKDLDKNGIPELLIAGIDLKNPSYSIYDTPVLFELCTLVNNTPVNLCTSWARNRFYFMTDNRIYREASGGAAYTYFEFFDVAGDHMRFLEGYATANDNEYLAPNGMFHSSEWNGETEPFSIYGNYNNPDFIYQNPNGYDDLMVDCRSHCWMPQLTKIS